GNRCLNRSWRPVPPRPLPPPARAGGQLGGTCCPSLGPPRHPLPPSASSWGMWTRKCEFHHKREFDTAIIVWNCSEPTWLEITRERCRQARLAAAPPTRPCPHPLDGEVRAGGGWRSVQKWF